MISDSAMLRDNQWPHNRELLEEARHSGCQVGLATMSRGELATQILDVLGLAEEFNFVATRDDVGNGKPAPEIYLMVAEAIDLACSIPVITMALERRFRSREETPFADRLLAAMRNQFGGHAVKEAD
jgi:hypothetical protein